MADQNKLTVAELLARNNKARGEKESKKDNRSCLLYTSDAADDAPRV